MVTLVVATQAESRRVSRPRLLSRTFCFSRDAASGSARAPSTASRSLKRLDPVNRSLDNKQTSFDIGPSVFVRSDRRLLLELRKNAPIFSISLAARCPRD